MSVVCSIRDEVLDRPSRSSTSRIEYATIVKVLASANVIVHGVSKELAHDLQSISVIPPKGHRSPSHEESIPMDSFTFILNTMANHGWKVVSTFNNSIILERTVSTEVKDVMSS